MFLTALTTADLKSVGTGSSLACLTWHPEDMPVLGMAHRLGVPTVFGTTAVSRPGWARRGPIRRTSRDERPSSRS